MRRVLMTLTVLALSGCGADSGGPRVADALPPGSPAPPAQGPAAGPGRGKPTVAPGSPQPLDKMAPLRP